MNSIPPSWCPRPTRLALSLALAAGLWSCLNPPAAAQPDVFPAGTGLSTRDPAAASAAPRLRLLPALQDRSAADSLATLPRVSGGGLLGQGLVADLYLSGSGFGPRVEGGFRATSGLLQAPSQAGGGLSLQRSEAAGPLPYLGVGYGGLLIGSGLSVQADLGLVAASGTVRFGRSLQSGPAIEDLIRELRLAPVVRVGVSYAF